MKANGQGASKLKNKFTDMQHTKKIKSNDMKKKNLKMVNPKKTGKKEKQIDTSTSKSQPKNKMSHKFQKQNTSSDASSENQQASKRKNESSDTQPTKKMKPDNMEGDDSKILHVNKKEANTNKPGFKLKSMRRNKMRRERKLHKLQKKGHADRFDIGMKMKMLWEELRREDCKAERKSELVKQIYELIKGRARELAFAHDTVRVLECFFGHADEMHKIILFEELKNDILHLTKSQYGKFLIIKMLKCGSKSQKETIMKTFSGQIISLIQHTYAAGVVEVAFNEYASSSQRRDYIQEFYGATYKYFKDSNIRSLEELCEKFPDKKSDILKNMEKDLLKIVNKSVVRHSIVHCILLQFLENVESNTKADMIEAVKDAVPEILHTKEGSRVAMHCIWFGNVKVRKAIMKSMKTLISKVAMEEFGHMVLLSLFDSVDDTVFLIKYIVQELLKNLQEIALNVHGRKVLMYLLNHRDSQYFHPHIIDILKKGDNNGISKKDPKIRQEELKLAVCGPLLEFVKSNIQNQYTNNGFCLLAFSVIEHAPGDKKGIYDAIAEVCAEPYTTDNKTHIIESSGCHYFFKKLIAMDKKSLEVKCKFSDTFLNRVPKLVPRSWIECNRGAFLLASLLETEIPSVVQRIKMDLKGCEASLRQKSFQGAKILVEKLNM